MSGAQGSRLREEHGRRRWREAPLEPDPAALRPLLARGARSLLIAATEKHDVPSYAAQHQDEEQCDGN